MALPKLNDKPKYEVVIPSTQTKVKFRPYLVKEEKILMIAMESQDQRQMLNAVVDTIEACIEQPIKRAKLTVFDVEYLFTQIRAKSVGETAKVGLKCKECQHPNEITVKLDDIKVEIKKVNNTLDLGNNIKLKMQWPMYEGVINIENLNPEVSTTEQTFDMIIQCIESVQTEDELFNITEEPRDEVIAFIESLNTQQFMQIREFVESAPKMTHDVNYKCESCGTDNSVVLEGMNDFL